MAYPKGWPKPQSSGIKKGQKQYKTIAKEKAREVFEQKQLERWELISKKQAKDALANRQAREYTINQVIGKPKETIEHQGLDFIFDD